MFSQLIAFHEPELSNHLEEIGFSPDVSIICMLQHDCTIVVNGFDTVETSNHEICPSV